MQAFGKRDATVSAEHRGWYSRGYLPHFDSSHVVQHVTYHLDDSMPVASLDRMRHELAGLPPARRGIARSRRIQELADAGHGSCVLRLPAAAELVETAFVYYDGQRYRLLAWVVMPNHVHVLFEPLEGWPLGVVVRSWKSYTGRRLAPMIEASEGARSTRKRVWQRDFWDRRIRDEEHLLKTVAYIHNNPVKAGLVVDAPDWPWSSARLVDGGNTSQTGE